MTPEEEKETGLISYQLLMEKIREERIREIEGPICESVVVRIFISCFTS